MTILPAAIAMRPSTEGTDQTLLVAPKEEVHANETGHPDLSTAGYVDVSTDVNFGMWRRQSFMERRNDQGTCTAVKSSARTCCKNIKYARPPLWTVEQI
ncbi:hypothetical protein TNCV_158091 [Trichonephila clavipes]|nr:hypothetical protein TNCV_158091 [Trichonephila clavipes]